MTHNNKYMVSEEVVLRSATLLRTRANSSDNYIKKIRAALVVNSFYQTVLNVFDGET